MNKILVCIFAAPSLCFALANDLILMQRNATDTGTLTRIVPWTSYNSLYWYDPATMQPQLMAIGSGLSVTAGVLSASSADWSTLTGKPSWTSTFDGSYTSLTGKPAFASVALSGAYADLTGKPSLVAVAFTGSYNDLGDKPTIPTIPTRSFSYVTRSLNSCFQPSAARDALVTYSVDIQTSLSLTAGQQGTVYLETFSDSSCTTGAQEIARFVNGQTGTLTIGLALTQNVTGTLTGVIPAGAYVKLRTQNNTGAPTFTARPGQETLL